MFASVYDIFEKNSEMLGGSVSDKDQARHMMRKMVNSMSAKMEIGSSMASMYLLGHPDHYPSHKYIPFAWRPYVQLIRAFWVPTVVDEEIQEQKDDEERVLIAKQDGKFIASSGVDDYRYRPVVYNNVTLYEWIQCLEKKKRTPRERADFEKELRWAKYLKADYHRAAMKHKDQRPVRHAFIPDHEQFLSHSAMCRFEKLTRAIPNFIGGALPRSDKGDRAAYCMTM
ncbi:hypothetical protein B0H17DRAFT_852688, partial [Mycena rosella]